MNQRSSKLQSKTIPTEEDFRTLLNTNSRGSSEITAVRVKMIKSEITSQTSGKKNEMKLNLNLQIRETIEQVISEQVLPTIRDALGELETGARAIVDIASSGRHMSTGVNGPKRVWGIVIKIGKNAKNQNRHNKESSIDPHSNDDDFKKVTGANPAPRTFREFLTAPPRKPKQFSTY